MAMPAMPIGEAQGAGEQGRVLPVELRQQSEGWAGRGRGWHRCKTRGIAVQPKEQRRLTHSLPAQSAVRVERRQALGPDQLARIASGRQFG